MKRHPDEKIIYGLFDNRAQLEKAYAKLLDVGISDDDISLLMNEDVHTRDFKVLERTRTKEGIAAGSVIGGALGTVLGGVLALGTVISGIGLVIVGPMIALAAAGGLVGGWIAHGMPAEEAKRLQTALHEGRAMIAVHVHDRVDIMESQRIFTRFHAEELELAS